jgi:geranylgeranyl diphosphate synthase type I
MHVRSGDWEYNGFTENGITKNISNKQQAFSLRLAAYCLPQEIYMSLNNLSTTMIPAIEDKMQAVFMEAHTPATAEIHEMMTYHLGWTGEGAGAKVQGKRIRPLIVTLTAGAAGGDWQAALPAAASVEILHNFSLVHDDIQDDSPLRRGRPTVWKLQGIPQAINTGDVMYTLAYTAMLGLSKTTSAEIALEGTNILQQTCITLTQGQYLDMSFETRGDVSLDEYYLMIGGKTASLLAACTDLGALAAGASPEKRVAYREFGRYVGLAFQVQDDLLGIWGDAELTGKSAESDIVAGKKSIPILYGLEQGGDFAKRWVQGPVGYEEAVELAKQLEAEGARAYTSEKADELTQKALNYLEEAAPQGEAGEALSELAGMLLKRNK